NPARCSSLELSRTSNTRWCKPRSSGSPMYMPGRFRTASSPSSLSIWAASYFCALPIPAGRADETDFAGKSSSVFGIEDGRATTDKYGSEKCACDNKYLVKISGYRAPGLELAEPKTPAGCGQQLLV